MIADVNLISFQHIQILEKSSKECLPGSPKKRLVKLVRMILRKYGINGEQYNIDVRADGGYIMCPGSIHPDTGKWYEEVEPWTLDLLMQCPVYDPQWVPCKRAGKTPKKSAVSVPVAVISEDHAERINGIELPIAERKKMAVRYLESVPGTKQGDGADRRCTALNPVGAPV